MTVRRGMSLFALLFVVALMVGTPVNAEEKKAEDKKKKLVWTKLDEKKVAKGKELFQTKLCFTCHNPALNVPIYPPLHAEGVWGREREVHIGGPAGPLKKIVADRAYILESIKQPDVKLVKGMVPNLMKATLAAVKFTDEEYDALAEFVMSLTPKKRREEHAKK